MRQELLSYLTLNERLSVRLNNSNEQARHG
jgi:hypothetical protein